MKDLVSVIVPVNDNDEYLDECIHSIINQSYANIEILIIDNYSLKRNINKCDSFLKKDIRVRVVHNQIPESEATLRNTAINIAKGEYIVFVEANDYINTEFVKDLYNACINGNSDIAQCTYMYVSDDTGFSRLSDEDKQKIYEQDSVDIYSDFDDIRVSSAGSDNVYNEMYCYTGKDMIKNLFNEYARYTEMLNTKMYKASLFDKENENKFSKKHGSGISFPTERHHENEAVVYRLLYESQNVVFLLKPLYYKRDDDGKESMVNTTTNELDKLISYEERMLFFLYNKEKELYMLSAKKMLEQLIMSRNKVKKYIAKSASMQKDLHKRARNLYFKIARMSNVSLGYKISMFRKLWIYTWSNDLEKEESRIRKEKQGDKL